MERIGSTPVYLVKSDDENIGTIYTLLPANLGYGERNLEISTLREFIERAENEAIMPTRNDLLDLLGSLVRKFD
jgi:hypothetical protein